MNSHNEEDSNDMPISGRSDRENEAANAAGDLDALQQISLIGDDPDFPKLREVLTALFNNELDQGDDPSAQYKNFYRNIIEQTLLRAEKASE